MTPFVSFLLVIFVKYVLSTEFIKYSQSPVYITGAVKGIKPYIPAIFGNAYLIARLFKSYSIIIYCNKTDIDILKSSGIMQNDTNIYVIEEGDYGPGFEKKVPARLAIARNKLLNEVRRQVEEKKESVDSAFMVMMDMDKVIGHVFNRSVLEDALDQNAQWDSVSFNKKRYYDIWALRYNKFNSNVWGFTRPDADRLVEILMRDISQLLATDVENQFFPVFSAFNGVAIYKLLATEDCEYDGENREPFVISPSGDCEHVAFHNCMREKNKAKIVIDKKILDTRESWLPPSPPKNVSAKVTYFWIFVGLTLLALLSWGAWRYLDQKQRKNDSLK